MPDRTPPTALPLIAPGATAAVFVMFAPAIFLPSREPSNRLMEFFEVVMGRTGAVRREPPAAG